jgi:hypothetical protein
VGYIVATSPDLPSTVHSRQTVQVTAVRLVWHVRRGSARLYMYYRTLHEVLEPHTIRAVARRAERRDYTQATPLGSSREEPCPPPGGFGPAFWGRWARRDGLMKPEPQPFSVPADRMAAHLDVRSPLRTIPGEPRCLAALPAPVDQCSAWLRVHWSMAAIFAVRVGACNGASPR